MVVTVAPTTSSSEMSNEDNPNLNKFTTVWQIKPRADQAPTARAIVAWGIAPGTDRVVFIRAESPLYSGILSLSYKSGLQPL
jgi:hypothetical protein